MEEIKRKGNTTNVKVLTSLARSVATAAMLKHGANVSNDGLGAMGLAECAPVLCAGDLKYELDATGLHKCVWQCPAGQVPDTFESAGADLSQSGHDANVTLAEAESMHKVAEEGAKSQRSRSPMETLSFPTSSLKLPGLVLKARLLRPEPSLSSGLKHCPGCPPWIWTPGQVMFEQGKLLVGVIQSGCKDALLTLDEFLAGETAVLLPNPNKRTS